MKNVVLLVDSKTRDLDVATLIAFHLRSRGIECHLEPLEADRAVVAAYKPDMIIFNHLAASHLVAYSKRLAEMGVLVAVLPNEGIYYDDDQARFYAGLHHNSAHIDYFFCWNERHKEMILEQGHFRNTSVEVVGVPRFDYYFKPWSNVVYKEKPRNPQRPNILFCTNFGTAPYYELPREFADKLFAPWAGRIPIYTEYWKSIEAQWRSRQGAYDHFKALVNKDKYEILLRPHPMEDAAYYRENWLAPLTLAQQAHVTLDNTTNITPLILGCDLQISCETCTTALESWIARKPTIELLFDKDRLWFHAEQAIANVPCDDPSLLVHLVDEQLNHPLDPLVYEARERHLAKWCSSPNGSSSEQIARVIAQALEIKKNHDWSKLTRTDWRKGLKLKGLRRLGVAYHFDPFLSIKRALFAKRYAVKYFSYSKSIKPRDAVIARRRLERGIT
jgi:surface carbohydrate biosynthesis protein